MEHPQQDKRYLCHAIRSFILGVKKKHGTARSQVHYRDLLATYFTAKRKRGARR